MTKTTNWLDATVSQIFWWQSDVAMGYNVRRIRTDILRKRQAKNELWRNKRCKKQKGWNFQRDENVNKLIQEMPLRAFLSSPFSIFWLWYRSSWRIIFLLHISTSFRSTFSSLIEKCDNSCHSIGITLCIASPVPNIIKKHGNQIFTTLSSCPRTNFSRTTCN